MTLFTKKLNCSAVIFGISSFSYICDSYAIDINGNSQSLEIEDAPMPSLNTVREILQKNTENPEQALINLLENVEITTDTDEDSIVIRFDDHFLEQNAK
jgi:hypothetical protein